MVSQFLANHLLIKTNVPLNNAVPALSVGLGGVLVLEEGWLDCVLDGLEVTFWLLADEVGTGMVLSPLSVDAGPDERLVSCLLPWSSVPATKVDRRITQSSALPPDGRRSLIAATLSQRNEEPDAVDHGFSQRTQ